MQYAKLDPDKHIDCYLGNEDEEQAVYNLARALANEDRIKIIRLILKQPLNIYEIARKLNLPFSTVSNHITVLEDAGLINVETVQGVKRHVKMCGRKLHRIAFYFKNNQQDTHSSEVFTLEMPVGHFTEAEVSKPCGLYVTDANNENGHFIATDRPFIFFSPERFNAQLIWFGSGFVSYNFINNCYEKTCSKLELSLELCSEITYHRNDWPSDIFIKINEVYALTILSPGDYGGRRGKYSPTNIPIENTQFGLLYNIKIDNTGVYLNNTLINNLTIDDFAIPSNPYVKLTIGVDENATHCGGVNIFGKGVGDYDQPILLTLHP
ncbi:MAG: ArsR family transcriptional regulator [Clostridia bacterium]|nr:ArsR family transcriptional regulator [Clostridia bacterium]